MESLRKQCRKTNGERQKTMKNLGKLMENIDNLWKFEKICLEKDGISANSCGKIKKS